MKKKRKIFESLRFNVFSFVYNVFLKFATPLESGEPKTQEARVICFLSFILLSLVNSFSIWLNFVSVILKL